MKLRLYSYQTLAHAVEMAKRNIDYRAFRKSECELLEQQLEEAVRALRELAYAQSEERREKA